MSNISELVKAQERKSDPRHSKGVVKTLRVPPQELAAIENFVESMGTSFGAVMRAGVLLLMAQAKQ